MKASAKSGAHSIFLCCFILYCSVNLSVSLEHEGFFTSSPQNVTVFVGSYVRLNWDFKVQPEDSLRRVSFGISDGHVLTKGLAVKMNSMNGWKVLKNPDYPDYTSRMDVDINTSTLLITNLTANDSGFYVCVLDMGLNFPFVMSHVYVTVTDILIDNITSSAALKTWFKHKIKLVCSTRTVSTPTFKWYRKSNIGGKITVVTQGIVARQAKSILKLEVTDVKDFGVYICIATTKVATVRHDITVNKIDPPSAPQALHFIVRSETSNEKGVELKWFAPKMSGGLSVTNYTVEKREHGSNEWQQALITSTTTGFLSNLNRDKNYQIRVQANSEAGFGEFSDILDLTLIAPSQPLSVSYTVARVDGTTVIRLVWDPPRKNAGAPVLEYIIEKRFYGTTTWKLATKTQFTYVDVFLDYSKNHQLRVLTRSTAGKGDPSDVLNIIWIKPGRPESLNYMLVAENCTWCVNLTWEAHDRGKPSIIEYVVKTRVVGKTGWIHAARTKSTFLLLKNLDHSYNHQFKVYSVNRLGSSEPSDVLDIPLAYSASGQTSGCEYTSKVCCLLLYIINIAFGLKMIL